jgi:hypothetical protein
MNDRKKQGKSHSPISNRRVIVAFAVAPLASPFVLLGVDSAMHPTSDARLPVISALAIVALLGLPVAYLAEILIGLPMWKLLSALGIRSLFVFGLTGAAIGTLPALLRGDALAIPLFAIAGAVSAVIFWAIVFYEGNADQGIKTSE